MTDPECPYCGGNPELQHVDQGSQDEFWRCCDCASEFARSGIAGALVYVLDFDVWDEPEMPHGRGREANGPSTVSDR